GGGVPEGGVAREVGLGDLDGPAVDGGVVDVVLGEAPGLDHRRAQHEGVDLPAVGGELVGDGDRLGDHVAAQGGVGTGDDVQPVGGDASGEHPRHDPPVHLDRRILVDGAGVGQHEAGGAGLGEHGDRDLRVLV